MPEYNIEERVIREREKEMVIESLKGNFDGIKYFVEDYFRFRDDIVDLKRQLKKIEKDLYVVHMPTSTDY